MTELAREIGEKEIEKILEEEEKKRKKEREVAEWLQSIDIPTSFSSVFIREGFDMQSLKLLDKSALDKLNIPLGVSLKILNSIQSASQSLHSPHSPHNKVQYKVPTPPNSSGGSKRSSGSNELKIPHSHSFEYEEQGNNNSHNFNFSKMDKHSLSGSESHLQSHLQGQEVNMEERGHSEEDKTRGYLPFLSSKEAEEHNNQNSFMPNNNPFQGHQQTSYTPHLVLRRIPSKKDIRGENGPHSNRSSEEVGEEENWLAEMLEEMRKKDVPIIDKSKLEMKYVIGEGFFSKVRLATWNSINVAVKTISEDKRYKSRTSREIFTKEVAILSKLRHPNIVQFLGVCFGEKEAYSIITEYMSGGTLFSFLKNGGFHKEPSSFFVIASQVCKGLIYLHDLSPPILHRFQKEILYQNILYLSLKKHQNRDLTSKNILLDDKLNAKVADFGVSREVSLNYLTTPVGALPYVAPEVYLTNSYSTKSDVYSFAIIMWEMITGMSAKGTMTAREMADKVAKEGYRPPLPSKAFQSFPLHDDRLFQLIQVAWASDPNIRPQFNALLSLLDELHLIDNSDYIDDTHKL